MEKKGNLRELWTNLLREVYSAYSSIMAQAHAATWVTVHTTTPHLPPSNARTHVTTPRLLIRPLQPSDLDSLHKLRTQPEVMCWSAAGRVDADREETAQKLLPFLAHNDDTPSSLNCALCWRKTGEVIGMGGMHLLNRVGDDDGDALPEKGFGWPEIGYMFRSEYWGMGLGTEFVGAFLQIWEGLERKPVEMRVSVSSLGDDSVVTGGAGRIGTIAATAKEQLIAVVESRNAASARILQKCGFEKFVDFKQKHQQDPNNILTLHGYRWCPGVQSTYMGANEQSSAGLHC